MTTGPFKATIQSAEELRSLSSPPSELVRNKAISRLDHHCRDFISKSPLLFLSTSDARGNCDVSPRGDAPGFVYIMDDTRLVIPERPGNRRYDSLLNIVQNPHAGLIFIIPGLEETLRMNGKACITTDPELMEKLSAQGKIPQIGIGVEIEECYIHCAKAFKRSKLWNPEHWPEEEELPNPAAIIAEHARGLKVTEEQVARSLAESYEKRLY
ncbi:pyridoxamine 5'-phosphate oxidase family protein [Paenibacillus sp. XY044]|uniref:pyridoxamine 5'-phosphate oxidase family protein n=1 Tax=Paenibacillus sp. XY044 TaxID=2026089 RepID=UPI000B98E6B8|nr:pyridoxamine 5'-phosphate oxidase family protein [Paenibacillus sp. XY044]OZB97958.1 phosphohydrolase [Paenibacillus sp. XY044]